MRQEDTVEFPSGMVATVRNWAPGHITRIIKSKKLANQPGPAMEAKLVNSAWVSTDELGPYAFTGSPPWLQKMFIGDLITAQWSQRKLTWGDKADYDAPCGRPGCKGVTPLVVDLDDFRVVRANEEALAAIENDNRIDFTLPGCGKKLAYGLQTGQMMVRAHKIAWQLRGETGGDDDGDRPEVLWASRIWDIEGVNKRHLVAFIDRLDPEDYTALKREFERIDFGLDTEIHFACNECGHEQVQDYPFGLDFYSPVLTEKRVKRERAVAEEPTSG